MTRRYGTGVGHAKWIKGNGHTIQSHPAPVDGGMNEKSRGPGTGRGRRVVWAGMREVLALFGDARNLSGGLANAPADFPAAGAAVYPSRRCAPP